MAGAVLACLAAVLLASGLGPVAVTGDGPLDRWRLPVDEDPAAAPEPADEAVVDTAEPDEPALGIPVEVLVAMVVTVVASALLVRAVVTARRPDDEADDEGPAAPEDRLGQTVDLGAVAEAARRGLLRLDQVDGSDAAEVVVACWVELEVAAGRLGTGRQATDTPTEFAARLSAAVPGLDPAVLDGLRRTYSGARYGRAGTSSDDVRRARAALSHLLGTLEGVLGHGRTR